MKFTNLHESAGEIPDAGDIPAGDEGSKGHGRAAAGGEIGVNGYLYKGGQFLPSSSAPPGTWRINAKGKNKLVNAQIDLIAPGVREAQPTPYSRAIFQLVKEIVRVDANGVMELDPVRPPAAIEHFCRDIRPGAYGVFSQGTYDVEELIDLYNQGHRWLDFTPQG